jgi:hypothetical protein
MRRLPVERDEPAVRVADVLAELARAAPSPVFDEQAEVVAKTLAAKILSRDWAGKLTIPAQDAERLLWSLRRDQAQEDRERVERIREAEAEYAGRLPRGTVMLQRPGEPDVIAPWAEVHRVGRQGITSTPGGG